MSDHNPRTDALFAIDHALEQLEDHYREDVRFAVAVRAILDLYRLPAKPGAGVPQEPYLDALRRICEQSE